MRATSGPARKPLWPSAYFLLLASHFVWKVLQLLLCPRMLYLDPVRNHVRNARMCTVVQARPSVLSGRLVSLPLSEPLLLFPQIPPAIKHVLLLVVLLQGVGGGKHEPVRAPPGLLLGCLNMVLLWFAGPHGQPFRFQCGDQGIHIPRLAERLQFKPSPLELDGVVVDYNSDTGYMQLEAAQEFLAAGRGDAADNAILVTGQSAGEDLCLVGYGWGYKQTGLASGLWGRLGLPAEGRALGCSCMGPSGRHGLLHGTALCGTRSIPALCSHRTSPASRLSSGKRGLSSRQRCWRAAARWLQAARWPALTARC
jgi:hypothetical protein